MNPRWSVVMLATVSALCWTSSLWGQQRVPMQADFDDCNRQAQHAVKVPSASPSTASSAQQGPLMGRPAASSAAAAESPAATARPADGTKTGPLLGRPAPDPSGVGATAPDPLLNGIAATGQGDPVYQQAYRDCMRSKTR